VSLWWWPASFLAEMACVVDLHSLGWAVATAILVAGLVAEFHVSGWQLSSLILPVSINTLCSVAALLARAISYHAHL
jgi:hypothetical protein